MPVQHRTLALCFHELVWVLFACLFSLGQETRASEWNSGKNDLKPRLKDTVQAEHFQFFWAETHLTFLP